MALLLAGAALTAAFWAPDRPVAELTARWAPPPSQFIAIEGMQVHLRDEGPRDDPSPILLLHGTSASLHTWEGWAQALRGQRRVISVDLPGFGLTGPFPDGDYRLAHYTRFLGELLDALGVRHAVIVGNSFGGQVAIEMALEQPDRVDKLILVDALAYPGDPASIPIGFRIARMPVLNQAMQYVLPRRVVEDSMRDVRAIRPRSRRHWWTAISTCPCAPATVLPCRRVSNTCPPKPAPRAFAKSAEPTLILWGARDRLIPPEHGEHLQRDIAGSRLVMFPGWAMSRRKKIPRSPSPPQLNSSTDRIVSNHMGVNG